MKRFFSLLVVLALASPLYAQNTANQNQNANPTFGPNQGQLRLVVVDQTGAGVPAATVTITPKTGGAKPVEFLSDERGLATSPVIATGDVIVKVEFPGFQVFEAPLSIKRGAQNQVATLVIEGFKEEVAVSDTTQRESAKSTSSFSLTQEEIDALPDDPDELAEYLSQMAGPGGATFFMNGFSGGRLPNRDQIRSIRFRQNNFAADNHDAGRTQIDIVTRPNTSWGGNVNTNFGSDTFNARQPQQANETPYGDKQVQLSIRGPIKAGRTSFSFNVNASDSFQSNPIIAVDRSGVPIDIAARTTNQQTGFQAGLEHSITNNTGMYFNFQRSSNEGYGQGVGGFTLPDRATTRFSDSNQLRFRLQGIIGGSKLNEFRVQWINQGNETFSVTPDEPSYNVQDASNFGGAGVLSNGSTNRVEIADNFDFNVGTKHQMRVGFLVENYWVSSIDERNKLGTWTYSSLFDYNTGRPRQFSQRIGTIDLDYKHYQGGLYWSDEFRLHRDLSVGFGVRNEFQAHIDDKINLMPRAGFSWAPFGSQRAAVRGGYGLFYDWYESSLYEQTLRVDGVRVRDIRVTCSIVNDYCANGSLSYSPIDAGVAVTAGGRIQAGEDLQMPRVHQASIGYDRQVTNNITIQTNYQILRGTHTIRSRNVNAPVGGVRPNPEFGDITQFESNGKTHSDRLTLGTQFRHQIKQQQMMVRVNYTLAKAMNYADGSTSLPSDSQNPDVDWGPSRQDIRHQLQIQGQVPVGWGVRVNPNLTLRSGSPYNITTGLDNNNDGTFNDRPEGVGRNAARGESYWMYNTVISKQINLGSLFTATPRGNANNGALFAQQGGFGGGGGGQGGFGGGGGGQGGFGGGGGQGGFGGQNNRGNNNNNRYRLELQLRIDNLFNHVTKTGYTGNLLSPYFGQATGVGQARQIDLSIRFNF